MKKKQKITIFLTMLFLLIALGGVKGVNATSTQINEIEIEIPNPVIGQIASEKSNVKVTANDNLIFETVEVKWLEYSNNTEKYELWTETNKEFKSNQKYAVLIEYKRPNEYKVYSNELNRVISTVKVNGKEINSNKVEEFNYADSGDANYDYDFVYYEFGYSQYEKEVKEVKVEIPNPVIGQTAAEKSSVKVTADDNMTFETLEVKWLKYNNNTEKYELWTETNKEFKSNQKYAVLIGYKRPNKYGMYSYELKKITSTVKVNEEKINENDINEFNYADSGDIDYDYDFVYFEFYKVIDGADQVYENKDISIRINCEIEQLEKVYINDIELSKENYTLTKGSTIITLKDSYLATLPKGTYTVKAQYAGGYSAETTFSKNGTEILDKDETPKTGITDNYFIIIFIVVVPLIILMKKAY